MVPPPPIPQDGAGRIRTLLHWMRLPYWKATVYTWCMADGIDTVTLVDGSAVLRDIANQETGIRANRKYHHVHTRRPFRRIL